MGAATTLGLAESEMKMRFQLNDSVAINISDEHGEVIGRAEYTHAEPSYLVRYATKKGEAVEVWWTENALRLG